MSHAPDGETEREGAGPERKPLPWQVKVLALISEQFAVPMDVLAGFLGADEAVARRLMDEFTSYRWVEVKQFFINDAPWIWLKKAGAENSGTGFAAKAPTVFQLPHHRAVCEARLHLEREFPEGEWIPERSLIRLGKGKEHYIPDGVFRVRNSNGGVERWAIEVERIQKTKKRYAAILAYRCAHYHRVVYVCTPRMAQALKRIPAFSDPKVKFIESLRELSEEPNFRWKISPSRGWANHERLGADSWQARVVRLIVEQEAIPLDQLARFLRRDLPSAERVAEHLEEARLIRRGLGPVDEGPWFWATEKAVRLSNLKVKTIIPSLLTASEMRLRNEARLLVRELDPAGRWVSRRVLLRGNRGAIVPAGLVTGGSRDYTVELEFGRSSRRALISKYERRYTEARRKNRQVLVICSTRKVKAFEELRLRCGWKNLFIEACPALDKPRAVKTKKQTVRQAGLPLVQIEASDLPPEVLREIEKKQGPVSLADLKLVGKRKGKGFPRWRVTTDKEVWRVTRTPWGWNTRAADEFEKAEELLPPKPKPKPRPPAKPRPKGPKPMPASLKRIMDMWSPVKALEAIQEKAELPRPPALVSVKPLRSGSPPRWHVDTDAGLWMVTKTEVRWTAVRWNGRSGGRT